MLYVAVGFDSVPEAICRGAVESGAAAEQVPRPFFVTSTELQVTVTEDTGIVGQPSNVADDACTVTFHGTL